jgi:uncharacterized membrane protein YqgA involved in biofilm formation
MTGTILNVTTVLIGSAVGLLLGARLPDRVRVVAMQGLGLVTLLIGVQMALRTENVLIVLASVALGGSLGALLRVDERLDGLGQWLEGRVKGYFPQQSDISQAFITASLVFCVGPMTILGSLQDGLTGDYRLLAVKALLDGIAAVAFASTLGVGVVFAAVTVLVYQGALTLGAALLKDLLSEAVIREMSATGGLLILGIGLRLLEIRRLALGDLLPALLAVPLVTAIGSRLAL